MKEKILNFQPFLLQEKGLRFIFQTALVYSMTKSHLIPLAMLIILQLRMGGGGARWGTLKGEGTR